jgi:hypothetical protein
MRANSLLSSVYDDWYLLYLPTSYQQTAATANVGTTDGGPPVPPPSSQALEEAAAGMAGQIEAWYSKAFELHSRRKGITDLA